MIRNEAPESMNGEYKVLVNGKKVTVTNMKTQEVATARCHPDDEFDLGVGVDEAIKKMEANRPIQVGDLVKVCGIGDTYTTYADWVYRNVEGSNKCRYAFNQYPNTDDTYDVLAIADHGGNNIMHNGVRLAYIKECGVPYGLGSCYLVDIDALEKVVD